ncbi:MAG TPA: polysaccharide deacetylase family protein [Candidatus Dormibacteraeota bacterium]
MRPGPISGRRIALTIDAEHPDRSRCRPGNCELLLAHLEEARVRATFFLQGRWVTAYPDLAREIGRAGHLVGNHSHYHARMPLFSTAGIEADVSAAEAAIRTVVGLDPRPWFRSPFGAGLDDPELELRLGRLGYRNVGWDVDGGDWEAERTPGQVEDQVVRGVLEGEGDQVVLVHSWPDQTAKELPSILARIRATGAEFVTIDELLDGPELAADLSGPAG